GSCQELALGLCGSRGRYDARHNPVPAGRQAAQRSWEKTKKGKHGKDLNAESGLDHHRTVDYRRVARRRFRISLRFRVGFGTVLDSLWLLRRLPRWHNALT